MDQGQLQSATAMRVLEARLEHIAENLANANTPAFKRLISGVELAEAGKPRATARPREVVVRDFAPGSLVVTDNPRDVALDGEGFFVLDQNGITRLTRRLQLTVGGDGNLQHRDGSRVMGEGGPISVPANASELTADADGNVTADGAVVGKLSVMVASHPGRLQADRAGTYRANPTELTQATTRVVAGAREESNVDVVNEMVAMMTTLRLYQASQRALQARDQVSQRLATS
ncbi:MAG: flagellar hook-basal body protein [Planctomycetota bacterium]